MYPRQAEGGGGGGGYGGNKVTTYGIIISVLENFGFIQTYEGDENVYFSVKDVSGLLPNVGDEVSFYVRSGPRGLIATNIRVLDAAHKVDNPYPFLLYSLNRPALAFLFAISPDQPTYSLCNA